MWIIELIKSLLHTGKSIKVDPDHLPGLRAPKSAPAKPLPPPHPQVPEQSDIESAYVRFLDKGYGKPFKKMKHKNKNKLF